MNYIKLGQIKLPTLVALSPEEQTKGLMFVEKPTIMSFPFIQSHVANFWMKNTYFPLDFIFVFGEKIVKLASASAMSEKLISSEMPCDLVVEMPKGFISRLKISDLVKVKLCFSTKTLAKYYSLISQ